VCAVFVWYYTCIVTTHIHTYAPVSHTHTLRESVAAWAQQANWWAQVYKSNWRYPEGAQIFDVFEPRNVPYAAAVVRSRLHPEVYMHSTPALRMHRLDEPAVHGRCMCMCMCV
jgi:hypothetical protein